MAFNSNTMSRFFIFGGGGHAKVVLDCLQEQGMKIEAVIDSKFSGDLLGVSRLPEAPPDSWNSDKIIVAIGDNKVRKNVVKTVGRSFFNAIHTTACISKNATVGTGCMILHRVVLQAGVSIGHHVIINTAAQVDHDCKVGDYVHLAPGSILCGTIEVGEGSLIGAGAVIKPGVKIGAWATIGSGAVVIKDIPDYAVAVGNPARIVKYIEP